jgi:hypothetical protein
VSEDPKRLLNAQSGGDAIERELLASVRRAGPPAGAKDEAWRAIAVQLAAGAAATAASGASVAAARAGAGSLLPGALAGKIALTVAAGGVAIGGYLAAQHAFAPAASNAVPSRARPALSADHGAAPAPGGGASSAPLQAVTTAAPQVQAEPAAEPAPIAEPERAIRRAVEPRRADLLAAESAWLAQARAQLRAGDARAAQATLEQLHARFPRGELDQEREVLAIEVLSAQGNAAAARRRARAFVATHPRSPHSATLTRFLDRP